MSVCLFIWVYLVFLSVNPSIYSSNLSHHVSLNTHTHTHTHTDTHTHTHTRQHTQTHTQLFFSTFMKHSSLTTDYIPLWSSSFPLPGRYDIISPLSSSKTPQS